MGQSVNVLVYAPAFRQLGGFSTAFGEAKENEMKIGFGSNDTAHLSAIQSVRVSDTGGKVKILVRHKAKRTEKVSAINFRKKIHYSPDVEITKEFAEKIAKECVKHILIKARTREEFKVWVEGSGNLRARFGKRMRLCEDDAQTLLEIEREVAHAERSRRQDSEGISV